MSRVPLRAAAGNPRGGRILIEFSRANEVIGARATGCGVVLPPIAPYGFGPTRLCSSWNLHVFSCPPSSNPADDQHYVRRIDAPRSHESMKTRLFAMAASSALVVLLVGCGAPHASSPTSAVSPATALPAVRSVANVSDSDVSFAQQMIPHHQQAVEC